MAQHELPDPLFHSGDLGQALRHNDETLLAEVENTPEAHLMQADVDEWVRSLVERYEIAVPELDVENMWMSPSQEVQVDVSWDHMRRAIIDPSQPMYIPGYRVVAHIPFTGDKGVFAFRASHFSFNSPRAEVRDDELRDVIEYPNDRPVDIKAHTDELIRRVNEHLMWSRSDIVRYNATLEPTARGAIENRRQRAQRNYEHLRATGLPVGPPGAEPKTYIAEAIVRRPPPRLPSATGSAPVSLEPVLLEATFEHILGVIRSIGQDMERSPRAYADKGEEDRRQFILAALNTHYRGQTTAEAFNVSGKTDILIRYEGQNLFIAECKFWSGQKGFTETIDQLFGYRAWRDTKLAVVMFVREKDLTSIIERAREALAGHDQFVDGREAPTETELRATVSWPGDERRHADLAVFFIHTPA